MTSRLTHCEFVDLYIGEKYADVKGFAGASKARVPVPAEFADQVIEIRSACKQSFASHEDSEFSLIFDDVLFRVTQIVDIDCTDVFILRRSSAELRPLSQVGLPPHLIAALNDKDLRGLVLVAGEMGTGKTTTAASIVANRLECHGGIAIAIEDPPETRLNGLHGNGRCIQVQASRKTGGYREHMVRAMRSGADLIMIGEIRDEETAIQAMQASINGHLIIATIHAGDVVQAIERLNTLCSSHSSKSADILAEGLAMVIWQTLERVPRHGGGGMAVRLVARSLLLQGQASAAIRTKLRKGAISTLHQEIDDQIRRVAWNQPGVGGPVAGMARSL